MTADGWRDPVRVSAAKAGVAAARRALKFPITRDGARYFAGGHEFASLTCAEVWVLHQTEGDTDE